MRFVPLLFSLSLCAATFVVDDGKGNLVFQVEGQPPKTIGKNGYEPALSKDGKRLIYTRSDEGPNRTLMYYEVGVAQPKKLIGGLVREAHWSPDDSKIVFLKIEGAKWQPWIMPAVDPSKASRVSTADISSIAGFSPDGSMIVASDSKNLLWIGLDGSTKRTVPLSEIYKYGEYQWSSSDHLRLHPTNPDVLLVSAFYDYEPKGAMTDGQGMSCGMYLYNFKTKQRTILTKPAIYAWEGAWSPDASWIYFTQLEKPHKMNIWKMKPDGTGLTRVMPGKDIALSK